MADCSGQGIGEDGDAKRPPLVFAMAEMERVAIREFQRLGSGARAGLFSFSPSRVYIEMGFGGV